MKKIIVFISIFLFYFSINILATEQTIVGQLVGGQPILLVSSDTLLLAFEDEWNDGSDFTEVVIEQYNYNLWILVAFGTKDTMNIVTHCNLSKDENNQFRIATTGSSNDLITCNYNLCGKSCCDRKICNCQYEKRGCEGAQSQCMPVAEKSATNGAGWLGNFY